jgi:hypothetical protein
MTKLSAKQLKHVLSQDGYSAVSPVTKRQQVDTNGNKPKRHKYNAQPTEVDGIKFASKAEANRYVELKQLERAGQIHGLTLQPSYRLQDAFTDGSGRRHRAIDYVADFEYVEDGRIVAEDCKGFLTPVYRIKAKLAIKKYPHIEFRETGKR